MTDTVSAVPAQAPSEPGDNKLSEPVSGERRADAHSRQAPKYAGENGAPGSLSAVAAQAAADAQAIIQQARDHARRWRGDSGLIHWPVNVSAAIILDEIADTAVALLARVAELETALREEQAWDLRGTGERLIASWQERFETASARAELAEAEAERLRADEARTREMLSMAERQVNDLRAEAQRLRAALGWIVEFPRTLDTSVRERARAALAGGDTA